MGFFSAKKKRAAACLVCLVLLPMTGCATERWCNELNDYSTLEADVAHCQRKTGVWGQVMPSAFDDCMKSLGWQPCQNNGDDYE